MRTDVGQTEEERRRGEHRMEEYMDYASKEETKWSQVDFESRFALDEETTDTVLLEEEY